MAYVTPSNRSTGDIVTAAIWNQDVVDNVKATGVGIVTTAGDVVYATAANALARLAIGAATTVLHGGAAAPAWSAVATADIANDAVDDTKAGNRVLRLDRRQGGDPTHWSNTPGTTNYTPTTVRCQVGQVLWSGGAASGGTVDLTFPTAFGARPLVFCATSDGSVYSTAVLLTTTTFRIIWYTIDGSAGITSVELSWLAVGPE